MPHLTGIRLSVSDPAKLAYFYVTHLGMTATETPDGCRVGYAGNDADILLQPGGGDYRPARSDRYWKIGITLPNVDIAYAQLRAADICVNKPHQFRDIGYMCHISDPEGFQIELLQQDFDGNRPADAGDEAQPLGGGARIGQVTLRTGDVKATSKRIDALGMRLLSIQPVADFGFTLYFWAFTAERPPHADLLAVGNREWLWKRPYTTLEIQHVDGLTPTENPGYAGLEIAGLTNGERNEISL